MPSLQRFFRLRPAHLASATLLVALAGASISSATAAPHERRGPGGPGMGIEQMLSGVDVSAEQRQQIESIMDKARGEQRADHEAERAAQQQMLRLLMAPTVDAAAVEALRQESLARHDTRSRRMTQALLDASAVLSAEQRRQLAEKMADRASRSAQRHGGAAR